MNYKFLCAFFLLLSLSLCFCAKEKVTKSPKVVEDTEDTTVAKATKATKSPKVAEYTEDTTVAKEAKVTKSPKGAEETEDTTVAKDTKEAKGTKGTAAKDSKKKENEVKHEESKPECAKENVTYQSSPTGTYEHNPTLLDLDANDHLECAYLCHKFFAKPGDGLNGTFTECKSAIYTPYNKPIVTVSNSTKEKTTLNGNCQFRGGAEPVCLDKKKLKSTTKATSVDIFCIKC